MSRLTFIFCILFIVGCTTVENQLPTEPVATQQVAQATPVPPTATSEPTATNTSVPTNTPRPTWTVIPTNTPALTAEPTVTMEPTVEIVATVELSATVETPSADEAVTLEPTTSVPVVAEVIVPTATPQPIVVATVTQLPMATQLPTATQLPPTEVPPTPVPPTATTVPPTATAVPPTAVPPPPTINQLASLPDGTEVTVVGKVVNTASFSQGFKFTVADETGRITLLMWHNVYDECWAANVLNVGATVVATGEIGRFEGELQIVPSWGGGVTVNDPAYAYATPQQVSNLRNVMGQRAMIEGNITDTFANEQFTKLQVNDGTGTVELFIWNNVWDRIGVRDQLVIGSHVKAVGVVGEFNGTIQIQPVLPVDVLR